MKKLLFSSILVLSVSLFFTACTKEGPAGPAGTAGVAGPAGPSGPTGATGPVGNMTITVKNISISTWTSGGGGKYYDGTAAVPEITNNIINGGAVLAYLSGGSSLTALPYTLSDLSVSYRFYCYLNTFGAEKSSVAVQPAPGTLNYRILIIPGALGSFAATGIGGTNYSLEELQKMSYTEACAALNIKP
jgi:hypothetical protein